MWLDSVIAQSRKRPQKGYLFLQESKEPKKQHLFSISGWPHLFIFSPPLTASQRSQLKKDGGEGSSTGGWGPGRGGIRSGLLMVIPDYISIHEKGSTHRTRMEGKRVQGKVDVQGDHVFTGFNTAGNGKKLSSGTLFLYIFSGTSCEDTL